MTKWTEKEENILKNQYQYLNDEELALAILNATGITRSSKSVEHRRKHLGLRKQNATEKKQSGESIGFFRINRFST